MKILLFLLFKLADNQHKSLFKLICWPLLVLNVQIRISKSQQFLTPADFQLAMRGEEVTFLTELDFINARRYKKSFAIENGRRKKNILTQQPFYRGDIRGKAALRRERRPWRRKLGTANGRRSNGVANVLKKWPSGRIPYVLSLEYSARERAMLARAFQEYHERTCIRFVPKSHFDDDYLFVGKIDGRSLSCYSDVGRAGGRQELSLDNGCLHIDTIIHELMHAVGFYHEHERWDRDKYLLILWQNIDKAFWMPSTNSDESTFSKVLTTKCLTTDYNSIMHYDSLAFSRNGLETLVTREPTMTKVIGSAIDFSPIDLSKIHRMYKCVTTPETEPNQLQSDNNEFINDNAITNPTQEFVGTPPFGMALPLAAEFTNVGQTNEGQMVVDPLSVPLYLRMNAPIWRKVPTQAGQNCADKTNLCAFWTPFCQSAPHKRIVQRMCQRSCNLCKDAQIFEKFYRGNSMKLFSFPKPAKEK